MAGNRYNVTLAGIDRIKNSYIIINRYKFGGEMGKLLKKLRRMAERIKRERKFREVPSIDESLLGIGATMRPPTISVELDVSFKESSGEEPQRGDEFPSNLRKSGVI
jgi:hypothetical protein